MQANLHSFAAHYQKMRSTLESLRTASPAALSPLLDPDRLNQLLRDLPTIGIGTPAAKEDLPQCALFWNSGSNSSCGSGVLVGDDIVLTAGHIQDRVRPDFVSLGISDAAQRAIVKVAVSYCRRTQTEWDIVLYRMQKKPGFAPIPAATTAEFEALRASGGSVELYGFGYGVTADGKPLPRGVKRYLANVPILPDSSALAKAIPKYDRNLMFVVGALGASAPFAVACVEDSGGPAIASIGGQPKLVGIIQGAYGGSDGAGAIARECGFATMAVLSRTDQPLTCP